MRSCSTTRRSPRYVNAIPNHTLLRAIALVDVSVQRFLIGLHFLKSRYFSRVTEAHRSVLRARIRSPHCLARRATHERQPENCADHADALVRHGEARFLRSRSRRPDSPGSQQRPPPRISSEQLLQASGSAAPLVGCDFETQSGSAIRLRPRNEVRPCPNRRPPSLPPDCPAGSDGNHRNTNLLDARGVMKESAPPVKPWVGT